MFPIKNGLKQGEALSPLLFNFVLDYVIRWVHVKQDGLKVNGTLQLPVYVDEVNLISYIPQCYDDYFYKNDRQT